MRADVYLYKERGEGRGGGDARASSAAVVSSVVDDGQGVVVGA